jgi:hypothetical protein
LVAPHGEHRWAAAAVRCPVHGQGQLRIEIFHPPYMSRGRRPFTEDAPTEISYGGHYEPRTPNADSLQCVQLIRPMATTHSCDTEQRSSISPSPSTGRARPGSASPASPTWRPQLVDAGVIAAELRGPGVFSAATAAAEVGRTALAMAISPTAWPSTAAKTTVRPVAASSSRRPAS